MGVEDRLGVLVGLGVTERVTVPDTVAVGLVVCDDVTVVVWLGVELGCTHCA